MLLLLAAGCHGAAPRAGSAIGAVPGQLTMTPCMHRDTIPAECGTLTLPERRDVTGSRLLSIPVTRIRATGPTNKSPIFFLNGGPGATNMRRRPPAWSRRDHDFVLVGFRGVDGSDRLDCPELLRVVTAEFRYTPMTFRVKRKLSQLAKWSVAGIAIVLAGVIFAGWKLGPW